MRFFGEMSLEAIGKELNLTRERVRQIEAKALRNLRTPSRNAILKGFLDIRIVTNCFIKPTMTL